MDAFRPSTWDLRVKVGVALGVVLFTSVLAVLLPAWRVWERRSAAEAVNMAGRLRMLSQRVAKTAVLAKEGHETAQYELRNTRQEADRMLDRLQEMPDDVLRPETRQRLDRVRTRWRALEGRVEAYLDVSGSEEMIRRHRTALTTASDSVLAEAERVVYHLEQHSMANVDRAVLLSILLLIAQFVVGGVALWALERSVTPLSQLTAAVEKMSQGDEDVQVDIDRDDEVGRLAEAFNLMSRSIEHHEQKLRRAKNRYRKIFSEAPYAIILTKADGAVLDANRRAYEMLCVGEGRRDELDVVDYYVDASRRTEYLKRMARDGGVEDFEAELRRADGSTFQALLSGKKRPDLGGPVYQTTIKDVTARREAEQKRAVFEQAVDQAGDMIFITETDGEIWYANSAMEDVLGYSRDEVIGQDPSLFQSGETSDATYEELWATLQRGDVYRNTLTDRRKDGTLVHIEQTITPIEDDDGEVVYFVSSGRDVTDRVERETQLEVLNRMLRHDIDNATTHVLSYSDLLEDASREDRRQEFRDAIRRAGLQIKQLTQSARMYMQAVVKDELEIGRLDLVELVRDQLHAAKSLYDGLEVRGDDLPSEPVFVEGTEMLTTVIGNLLHNAVKHSQSETVHVDVALGVRDDDTVRLHVADDGPGIPTEKKVQIFGKGESEGPGSGTGMGLFLTREVVEQCGGRIWVEDNEPRGSVFVVELRRSKKPVARA